MVTEMRIKAALQGLAGDLNSDIAHLERLTHLTSSAEWKEFLGKLTDDLTDVVNQYLEEESNWPNNSDESF